MNRTTTREHFEDWARENAPIVRAYLLAEAHALHERERVDAYTRPIFDRYQFLHQGEIAEKLGLVGTPVPSPADLYLTDLDAPDVRAYYAEVRAANVAHGWRGDPEMCPALVAGHLVIEAERFLIDSAEGLLGISADRLDGGDRRAEYLKLLVGGAICVVPDELTPARVLAGIGGTTRDDTHTPS